MKKNVLLAPVLWLSLTALSLCVVGLLSLQIAYASPYTDIDVATAYDMITNGSYPDLVVLDVRNQSEYDGGHIYGAVWIPVWELETRIGELAGHKNHEIIVYCGSGVRSETASDILEFHNFTKVYNMLGGISAWQSAGYPVWIATVHNVNTTLNYDTIQAALDAPQTLSGHTILVDAGTYYENVVVRKSISLIGENRNTTVIDGNGTGNVIFIDVTTNDVTITGFTMRNGTSGIFIDQSDYNIISGNIVTDNQNGIRLFASCPCNPALGNTIRNNTIKNNGIGIALDVSKGGIIYHNSFIDNTVQTQYYPSESYVNVWDSGYPSGGNYWSDYPGVDTKSGPYRNETGSDGIGDTPYVISVGNADRYPLITTTIFRVGLSTRFGVVWKGETYHVDVTSNSTVTEFQFKQSDKMITLNVTGPPGTIGYCNVTIPKDLLKGEPWIVSVNGLPPTSGPIITPNTTHTSIYFTYTHSPLNVQITGAQAIPEFPTWTSLLLLLMVLTVAIAIYKRRLPKTSIR